MCVCVCVCVGVCVCVVCVWCVCVRECARFVTNQDIDCIMTQVLQGEGDFSGH